MKVTCTVSLALLAFALLAAGCKKNFDPAQATGTPAQVVDGNNNGLVQVNHSEQFALIAAASIDAPDKLSVTGSVFPDINREVPVISLASGKVVELRARLDDNVRKGQLLFKVQSPDISAAFDVYLKAVNDEQMSNKAYLRAKDLYEHGAIALGALEQAEDAEKNARADLEASDQQMATLGIDKQHPSSIVSIYAPIGGVVVGQNITNAAAAGVTYAGTSTAFTIADLSVVWIVCDVYENDLPRVALGQQAQITLSAYPGKTITGRVSDIGPVLDPTIRTAKVRIEVPNQGMMKLGMFASVTLQGRSSAVHEVVPASAILHLHDREWVFVPAGEGTFHRIEVSSGEVLGDGRQEILSGLAPGQQVVKDVLQLESALEAQ
jgi:cobalt-zinc-cadmium efflux system membrane fusion protein